MSASNMADRDELAERLVKAAGKTAFDEACKWFVPGPPVMGPTETTVGRSVVIAVLDELRRGASPDMQRQLAEIADRVSRARLGGEISDET